MASGANRNFVGYYMGTGAAQTIGVCGFDPRYVRTINLDDRAELEWFSEMPSLGSASRGGHKRVAAGTSTALTSAQGISPSGDGDVGFVVGTDLSCNAAGVQYAFLAND